MSPSPGIVGKPLYTLTKEFRFEAAHRLQDHDGKCQRLHGHSWLMLVELDGEALLDSGPKQNMLMDYSDIKRVVQPWVETYLDHHFLNDTLKSLNPTSEFIAKWMYDQLKPMIPMLVAVIIKETCTSACRYQP